jgi:glycosyltransferase involved in cell wall biosynthesis
MRDLKAGLIPPQVLAIGPFPPFVGGAAKNTAIICDAFEDRGADVRRLPTNSTRVRAEHTRSLSIYADRVVGFISNLRRIASTKKSMPRATVYLVPDGGLGIAFSMVYARAGTSAFPRLIVHHRNYSHIRNRSALMALLTRTHPERTLHVFLDPVMEAEFKSKYAADVQSLYVPNAATCDVKPAARAAGPQSGFTVGYLSNLTDDKGFDVVAEAFLQLAHNFGPQCHFLIAGRPIGDINAARLSNLRQILGERLDYRGEVSGQGKTDFFRACDVFVFPTRFSQEAQPNVLYEALAGGAAIVSTRWAGVPWVLQETVSRLIEAGPGRGADLAAAVTELVHSGELQTAPARQIAAFLAKRSEANARYTQLLDYVVGSPS